MKKLIGFFAMTLLVYACGSEEKSNLSPLDLTSYDVPVTIMAPDSANVKKMDMGGIMKDVTVKKGEDYYVQIYASQAATNDIAKLKSDQLADIKSNPFFSKIIKEEEAGFIYENKIDSTMTSHGFCYVYVQGDREFVFRTGLVGTFTLEEAEKMYEAVKQK